VRNPLEFRKPDPVVVSAAEVRAAIIAVGLPDGWTYADDLGMLTRAFTGYVLTGKDSARFHALRKALTSDGYLNLTLQMALLEAVKALAEQPAPALTHYASHRHSPDDVCRTCHGAGQLREPSGRGSTIVSVCHNCNGSGYGK
jgi:hypothetical protein